MVKEYREKVGQRIGGIKLYSELKKGSTANFVGKTNKEQYKT